MRAHITGTLCVCRRKDQGAGGLCISPVEENKQAMLELLNKDEENFPTLEASVQVELLRMNV